MIQVRANHPAGLAALTLLLAACAQNPATPTAEAPTPHRATIVPVAGHHQHLMSPMMLADWRTRNIPTNHPAVTLPPDLEQLLRAREAATSAEAMDAVFTEDAHALAQPANAWRRGRPAVRELMAGFAPGRRYSPHAYHRDGASGWIIGAAQRGEPLRDIGSFVHTLRRDADGRWRIASETLAGFPPPDYTAPITADELIAEMDEAGIRRAVILSLGYSWASSARQPPLADELEKVRAENDWTAAEAGRFPGRLVAFCGVNPLRDYAVAEIERCAGLAHVRGLKLHFGNSSVDVKNPEHVQKVRAVFAAADRNKLAIVAHVMPRNYAGYGAEHSRILLEQILPAAPNVTVQIAHMAASGPSYFPDEPMAFLAEAFAAGDPRLRNVYVDIAGQAHQSQSDEVWAVMAKRLRQVGMDRVLFGSDMHPNPALLASWAIMRRELPLTDQEIAAIADNVAPYLR